MSARDRIARALRRLFPPRPNPLPAHVTRHRWGDGDKRRLAVHIAAASAPAARKSKRRS